MSEGRLSCPECGHMLGITATTDPDTLEITIDVFCEGADEFHFQILTGLTEEILADFGFLGQREEVGKTYPREMGIKLLSRIPEEEL